MTSLGPFLHPIQTVYLCSGNLLQRMKYNKTQWDSSRLFQVVTDLSLFWLWTTVDDDKVISVQSCGVNHHGVYYSDLSHVRTSKSKDKTNIAQNGIRFSFKVVCLLEAKTFTLSLSLLWISSVNTRTALYINIKTKLLPHFPKFRCKYGRTSNGCNSLRSTFRYER